MTTTVRRGEALRTLRRIPANTFHAMLSDPPYGLSFMGKAWDKVVPSSELWAETLRVLRPGAHALVFGGTRTFHRLACALEDAGFEMRDCLLWLHGQGFPKHRASLKPAWEPVLLVRKRPEGTVVKNVRRWGCGALAIDACRIGDAPLSQHGRTGDRYGFTTAEPNGRAWSGRWPANVLLDDEAAAALDARVGTLRTHSGTVRMHNAPMGYSGRASGSERVIEADSGGPSRFFYCAKVSRTERNAGVAGGCTHPTLKPLALTTYLARLLLVPGPEARLLVPFSGAGSEIIGARRAGWRHVVGIERDAQSVADARARIAHHLGRRAA